MCLLPVDLPYKKSWKIILVRNSDLCKQRKNTEERISEGKIKLLFLIFNCSNTLQFVENIKSNNVLDYVGICIRNEWQQG